MQLGQARKSSQKPQAKEMNALKEFFDVEKQFALYGAYHHNKITVLIHMFFVWPTVLTAMILPAYSEKLAPLPSLMESFPLHRYMVFNYSFIVAAGYTIFYLCLERKAGTLTAASVMACWMGANAIAEIFPFEQALQVVLGAQVVWLTAEFVAHGLFEKRTRGIFLRNLPQQFLMGPFFIVLEILYLICKYEPYPGFEAKIQACVKDIIQAQNQGNSFFSRTREQAGYLS